jgi:hypothetical protein
MRYTVAWLPSAQNVLADIWNRASDRQAVADAANRIDAELRTDAHQKGRPLGGQQRDLRVTPLGVIFTVSPADRLATVLKVRRVP